MMRKQRSVDGRLGKGLLAGLEREVKAERKEWRRHVAPRAVPVVVPLQLANELPVHTKGDIGFQLGRFVGEYLRHQRAISGRRDNEMDMRRPVWMTPLRGEQGAHRAVGRHRIARRSYGAEMVVAVFIGMEAAAQIAGRLVRTLLDERVARVGSREVRIDGRDAGGRLLASGVYFFKLERGQRVDHGRVTILK